MNNRTEILRHISFTGIYAGETYCGKKPKENEMKSHLGAWVDNNELKICPECLEIYKKDTTNTIDGGIK